MDYVIPAEMDEDDCDRTTYGKDETGVHFASWSLVVTLSASEAAEPSNAAQRRSR